MELINKKVMVLIEQKFEDLELWYPILRLKEEKVKVDIVGKKSNYKYKGKHGLTAVSDISFENVECDDYDAVLIPGGWAPDKLRRYSKVKDIILKMHETSKIIGTICHAGWVLVSAGILKNKQVTSVSAIKDDMINAKAIWTNKEVVVDDNLITSRTPKDLPVYVKTIIEKLKD